MAKTFCLFDRAPYGVLYGTIIIVPCSVNFDFLIRNKLLTKNMSVVICQWNSFSKFTLQRMRKPDSIPTRSTISLIQDAIYIMILNSRSNIQLLLIFLFDKMVLYISACNFRRLDWAHKELLSRFIELLPQLFPLHPGTPCGESWTLCSTIVPAGCFFKQNKSPPSGWSFAFVLGISLKSSCWWHWLPPCSLWKSITTIRHYSESKSCWHSSCECSH